MTTFTEDETRRYSRQLLLDGFGELIENSAVIANLMVKADAQESESQNEDDKADAQESESQSDAE